MACIIPDLQVKEVYYSINTQKLHHQCPLQAPPREMPSMTIMEFSWQFVLDHQTFNLTS